MNYARNQSRWAFSKEQFFKDRATYVPYLVLAIGLAGFVVPLFTEMQFWMVFAKAGFIIWLAVLYADYFMRKEAHALILRKNEIVVRKGYLLPVNAVRAFGETEMRVTLSGDRVNGDLFQFPPVDAAIYNGREIDDQRLLDHLTATKRVPVHFLSLEQWKSLSDETGLPLTIDHSHADFESPAFEEQEEFIMYAPNEQVFEREVFDAILDLLHSRAEMEFLGKTEVYNAKEPIEQENIYHEFLWREDGNVYSLTACIDSIEFTYKEGSQPQVIKDLCRTFALQVEVD